MNWKELKHEINMAMVDFKKSFGLNCNILILGKKEYDILQGDEVRTALNNEPDDDLFTFGEVSQFWSMRICRMDIDSIVKTGHVM